MARNRTRGGGGKARSGKTSNTRTIPVSSSARTARGGQSSRSGQSSSRSGPSSRSGQSSSRSGTSSRSGSSSRSSGRGRSQRHSEDSRSHSREPRGFAGKPGELIRGTVQKNQRGFAFLIPAKKGIPDAFVPAEDAQGLLAGDVVEFSTRQSRGKSQARIHRVVQRGKSQVVGQVVNQNGDHFLRTISHDYLWILETERVEDGQWVLGQIVHYPTSETPATVRIKENFGKNLTPRHDLKLAIAEFGIHEEFSAESNAEALKKRGEARHEIEDTLGRPDEKGYRRDLTGLDFVTIDGPDAKDFDDAVYVATPTGGEVAYKLYVAIADVSFFVTPGSALEKDAKLRGTSVYFPGVCVPMLPESLSNDLCSLRPREKKLSLVAEIHFDREANIIDSLFYDGVIETRERLTYEQANDYALGKDTFAKYLKPMRSLFKKMLIKRAERGTLDFVLPENKVEVDDEGNPVKMGPYPSYESNKWIEEFMVAANRVVAKALKEAQEPALYRVHEAPDPKALDELNKIFKAMGFSHRLKDLTPPDFHDLLKKLEGHPKAGALNYMILRHQKQANYTPEPLGHFGLALEDYCHFTSPIRRFPDLIVHRAMKGVLHRKRGEQPPDKHDEYFALGQHCSQRERAASDAERWVVARKQCWYFEKELGRIVPAKITGMSPRGLFMNLDGTGADGMLEYDRIPGGATFDEEKYRVYLKNRKSLTLGDTFDVVITAIRWEDNRILIDPADKL